MTRPYIRRLVESSIAATILCLRQALRQHLFLVTFAPFALVLIAAVLMPAGSQTLGYRLLLKVSIGLGSVVMFLGVILTGTAGLPAEIQRGSAFRTVCSPGGRMSALTGRIGAFAILAALAAGVGFLGTLAVYHVRAGGSEEFASASVQYHAVSALRHESLVPPSRHAIFWVDEKAPAMTWVFPADSLPDGGKLRVEIVPVVASTIETRARLLARAGTCATEEQTINLFDKRPTRVELAAAAAGGELRLTIQRLPESSPFGFDIRKNELGSERNGVSLITSRRSFVANLLAAWFVIWLKLCFVASLGVFCSTFLSGPIAAALALALYLLANLLGFLHDFAASIGKPVIDACGHHIHHAPQEPTLMQKVTKELLTGFTCVYPDLAHFDPVAPLAWGRAIPLMFMILALLYYLAYSAGLWGASALILRGKEF